MDGGSAVPWHGVGGPASQKARSPRTPHIQRCDRGEQRGAPAHTPNLGRQHLWSSVRACMSCPRPRPASPFSAVSRQGGLARASPYPGPSAPMRFCGGMHGRARATPHLGRQPHRSTWHRCALVPPHLGRQPPCSTVWATQKVFRPTAMLRWSTTGKGTCAARGYGTLAGPRVSRAGKGKAREGCMVLGCLGVCVHAAW